MNKKTISVLIKTMIVLLGMTGFVCLLMMRRILDYLLPGFSGITHRYWLYFLYVCAVPCFLSLVPAWMISDNIGKNRSFCRDNAVLMKTIGIFMGIDTAVLVLANTFLYFIGRSFFAFFIAFFFVVAVFFALTVCALSLSSLLGNATELQEQSDFTI